MTPDVSGRVGFEAVRIVVRVLAVGSAIALLMLVSSVGGASSAASKTAEAASTSAGANTSWSTGMQAVLPANALTTNRQDVGIAGPSCPSAGNCTAVGSYTDSAGNGEGLLLTETAGVWANGVEMALPANAGGGLGSVSCASAGNCSAVGEYSESSGDIQGLLLTETAGVWTTAVIPLGISGGDGAPWARLGVVPFCRELHGPGWAGDCTHDGGCVGNPLILTETAGSWDTGFVPAGTWPFGAGVLQSRIPRPSEELHRRRRWASPERGRRSLGGRSRGSPARECGMTRSTSSPVSCSSPGNCSAVGTYTDNAGKQQGGC